jgi:hypothetical protein
VLLDLLLVAVRRVARGTAADLGPDVVEERSEHAVLAGVANHFLIHLRPELRVPRLRRGQLGVLGSRFDPGLEGVVLLLAGLVADESRFVGLAGDEGEELRVGGLVHIDEPSVAKGGEGLFLRLADIVLEIDAAQMTLAAGRRILCLQDRRDPLAEEVEGIGGGGGSGGEGEKESE